MIKIVLIGAGNVATHLYHAFKATDKASVIQWYSRDLRNIQEYHSEVDIIDNFNQLIDADVYILAISDDAIASVSSQLPFIDRLVVHTSGSTSLHDIDKKNRQGVFYPLQTFTASTDINFSEVPICIEINHKPDLEILKALASALGCKFYRVNSDQRSALHLAAVFVNNFSNQLYRIAHEITEASSVNFDILKPLISETANKVQELSPYKAQTGPAKRNDKKTIKKHLKTLTNEQHKAIYELMTKSIQQTHGKKL